MPTGRNIPTPETRTHSNCTVTTSSFTADSSQPGTSVYLTTLPHINTVREPVTEELEVL
jgi:hypothetical protein